MSFTPYAVYEYEDANGYSEIREWRKQLMKSNPKASAKVAWLIDLLEEKGTDLKMPYAKHIEGPIFELRGQSRHDYVRLYYWQQDKVIFIVAAGELKQQDKADPRLVKKALQAYQNYNKE
jgi:hypothetical protein